MGVENIYTLPLNGVPYISGSVAFDDETKDNKLILESNTKIDLHNSQYFSDEEGKDIYDERITRLMGAFGINSNLQNNKVLIDSANIVLHGPDGEYTARSTFEILGALADVNNLKKYNVSKNSVIIKNLNLDLMVNSQNKITFYDAVLFGEIYGGRTLQGNAEKNSIEVYHFNSLDHLNKNIKTHASLNLYGGYSNDGEANGNKIVFRLKKPLKISDNFYGKNYYNLYGGFATEGANFNVFDIQNDLTYEKVPQNYSDKFTVYAARTLSGKANNNTLSIKDSIISLPLYAFITSETTLDGIDYIADESNNNEVNFENIKSSKNLSLMINAKNVSNNKINYNLIQSLTEASSLGKGSKIILKATQNANNNLIKLKDCSSAAVESSCIIKADKESAFNKIIINNTAFSTASDKRQGYVGLIAGVSANSHDNIMELVNLNIDEYKNQDAIFLAPSGTSDISNFKSYNNTLYLGGELNFFKDVNIDLLSGSVFHEVNKKGKIITQILPHQEDFSKNNRLIIDTQDVKSEVVNNFENFTFILPNKIKNPILTIEKLINLPANGSMEILTKNKPTKGKYILIQSDVGIYDGDNGLLNQQELENLLEKMKNNKNKFNYNKIEKLAKSTLKNVNFSFEVSDDAKIIYINIL
ncbi:TPA: hypothetical protein R6Q84_000952 [Campylobacter jejuni]|nr:hypothetical protein [Campylobacter jejuni]HED9705117.1 hypothetical protein [Campylobacter jejuni]HED9908248.1 hypothetical protein [Campylobacter jejuni]HEF3739440.1 hypothetical protein [Campylobacter jejuni]